MNKDTIFYFNSNDSDQQNLMAVGVHEKLELNPNKSGLEQLEAFTVLHKKWIFGYLTYDLKDEVENLSSENHDELDFPRLFFFVPKVVYAESNGKFEIIASYDEDAQKEIDPRELLKSELSAEHRQVKFEARTSKKSYFEKFKKIIQHIKRGDIYEMNFCLEFFNRSIKLAPKATYWAANELTKAPFSSFLTHENHTAISCSPELFLQKSGEKLISKPIKGTRKRGESEQEDKKLIEELRNDQKEKSENVMIVDLVRNDLSKLAKKASVEVSELYGIHTFKTVHHMVSTVQAEVKEEVKLKDIFRATFPMGSMTGAPKVSAMEIIEEIEDSKRGLYSGSIGFIEPNGDFVFNVVIRTLLYNQSKNYLSVMAGGAITSKSTVESEYRECLLKASALKQAIFELK